MKVRVGTKTYNAIEIPTLPQYHTEAQEFYYRLMVAASQASTRMDGIELQWLTRVLDMNEESPGLVDRLLRVPRQFVFLDRGLASKLAKPMRGVVDLRRAEDRAVNFLITEKRGRAITAR